MVYHIRYSPHAERDHKKLPKEIQIRIVTALDILQENPEKHIKRLADLPLFSFRTGGYRIILALDDVDSIIKILKIGKRNHVDDNI
jgi:mRNA-degrading endonuclease RelE of RelBE toxin-antitoxin system